MRRKLGSVTRLRGDGTKQAPWTPTKPPLEWSWCVTRKWNAPMPCRIALYARVSSADQKSDLERQVQRLRDYAAARGYQVAKEATEIASGLNDSRPKFLKLLAVCRREADTAGQ